MADQISAKGDRSVSVGGDVTESVIITGDVTDGKVIAAGRDVIIYEGTKPVSTGDLLDACQAQVASVLDGVHHKYDPKLYVNRAIERDLNRFFDAPLDGPGPNCFLIVAQAGSGKTNLLCEMARVRATRQPALLLMGGNLYLGATSGLLGTIQAELQAANSKIDFRSAEDSLHTLHRLAEETNRDALLFLDAINEHEGPVAMRKAIEDLLRKTRERRVKLVVTCRDYYWGLFKGRFWEGATVNDLPPEADEEGEAEADFSHFAPDEHERALNLYLDHYQITGRPVGDAAEQCRHPLLLRFFCEAYRGQDVGEVEDIRLKELFDEYWDRKLTSIAERMLAQRKRDEEWLGEYDYKEDVRAYLLNLAAYMLHHNKRAIPHEELGKATDRQELPGDRRSIYGRIRDEFIILEEKERGKERRKVLQVAFVYEEFMEYVMALSLMRDWEEAALEEEAILAEIETLTDEYESFVQIFGVMVYLALMLKEKRDLVLWSLLLGKGKRWQEAVFEAFRKLPEEQLDSGVFDALAEILHSDDEHLQVQALDTLKVRRIGQAAPASIVEILDRLRAGKILVSRRAVLALGNMTVEFALPVLEKAVDDTRMDVRRNAVTALGQLQDVRAVQPLITAFRESNDEVQSLVIDELAKLEALGASTFEPLVAALGDSDSRMRLGAVIALTKLGDMRTVEPLIVALRDSDGQIRFRAALALGELGDVRAMEPLIDTLGDESWSVRRGAAVSLGGLGEAQAVEPLIGLLRDRDYRVRSGAAEALGELGDAQAVESLITGLSDDNALVRRRAAGSLGELGEVRALNSLIGLLNDHDDNVRYEAAEALGKLGDAQAVEPLIAALNDHNEGLREKAALALGRLGKPAVEALIVELRNSNWRVRQGAAEALGGLQDERAVGPLIVALKDGSKNVRSSAVTALRRIGTPEAVAAVREHKARERGR